MTCERALSLSLIRVWNGKQSNIKSLSTNNQVPLSVRALIQLSNERIEKAMEEAAQVLLSSMQ
jgi:hypothetical protein